MSNILKYGGYVAAVHYSSEDDAFYGKLIGINDLVTFEGSSVTSLKKEFKVAIDDYLETSLELGKQPDKTYNGNFNVRVPMSMHRKAALIAAQKNLTLNEFMKLAISYTIKHEQELDSELQQM